MKNKIINTAICDARSISEESLRGFESIIINTSVLIIGEHTKELLNRYPISVNARTVMEMPNELGVAVKSINGQGEIGPDTKGEGAFLMVNGKLTIMNDTQEAIKSYYRIMVNGMVIMPESFRGQFENIEMNGTAEYYPDGATVLKANTEIDNLFISRAENSFYYSFGTMFFLDTGIDITKIIENKMRFGAKRIVITESLLDKLSSLFSEKTELKCVPDGTRLINDDIELKPATIKNYGAKLYICGNVSIHEAGTLSSLEVMFVDGTISVDKDLEDIIESIECEYKKLNIIDPDVGYFSGRNIIKIGVSILKRYPNGVHVEDCARVYLAEELSPDAIMEKIHITDCAMVICTKEQEEAVTIAAEDVAMIRVSGENRIDELGEPLFPVVDNQSDTQVINAVEYSL